jgi:transposase-like protein
MQPEQGTSPTPKLTIDGVLYFTASDVARATGVTRQTLWRWRRDAKIPAGQKYRDKQVVFTREELERIREYAQRLEPLQADAATEPKEQLRLFAKGGKRG